MKNSIAFFLWTLVLLSVPKAALAHSVYIFAWADGPQICTESYFTQKSKVRGGEVHMLDASGEILDRGFTGEDGLYCFAPPTKSQTLFFEIHAGPGHKGKFTLEESDVAEAVEALKAAPPVKTTSTHPILHQGEANTLKAGLIESNLPDTGAPAPSQGDDTQATTRAHDSAQGALAEQDKQGGHSGHAGDSEDSGQGGQDKRAEQDPRDEPIAKGTASHETASTEAIRAIVRDELQKQLSPMRHYLAEKLEDTTPGLKEIVGGIGWLMGLGALGFWFSQRRRG